MVNTTRASLMAQIAELRHFRIITGYQEMEMVDKVNAWAKKWDTKQNEVCKHGT